jgi:phosphate transport system substrate-binding protein
VSITKRRSIGVAATLAVAVLATGCGSSKKSSNADLKATLNGSGSTLSKAFQEEAAKAFTGANKGVTINYAGGGSGKGRTDLAGQLVDFAGSDSPYKDADLAANKGGSVLYFPILLGPITVSYNLDGVDKLTLSADTIAKIFQRTVKTWDDAAIAADNPGVKLPSTAITVAHRSDGSGTTQNFTAYLAAAAPTTWTLKSGSTVDWPTDTQAGNGNGGVAKIITDTKGAIGYVDLSDAVSAKLKYASIKNKAGKVVEPTADSASAAGAAVTLADNLIFSALNADGDKAYPLTAQTWVIVYVKQADKAKADALKAYLKYLVTDGQKLLAGLDYAPLPKSITDKAMAQLDKITVG